MKLWPWSKFAALRLETQVAQMDAMVWRDRLDEALDLLNHARAQIAKFDHDGDGKPGGSKPKGKA